MKLSSKKMNKGLSITMIFKAQSLNYGEGIGNISELKKLSRGDGNVYTFASRQALRYDIARLGHQMFDWNLEVVDKSKGTVQFSDKYTIADSEEMDLFGYMKTSKKSEETDGGSDIRSAAVRVSNAISLENYRSDLEFLSNKGLADRINEFPNLANLEQHLSFYTYTITIDLEKIGVDGKIELSKDEKIRRVTQLLEIVKVLNREIMGRQENLSPLFVIGGIYPINTPFYLGRVALEGKDGEFKIKLNTLKETGELKVDNISVEENTEVGLVENIFANEEEIKNLYLGKVYHMQEFFENLEGKAQEYYNK